MAALRVVGWLAAGLVIGFALGGLPAERQRAALQRRVAELERALSRSERPNILDSFLPRLGPAGVRPEETAQAASQTAADAGLAASGNEAAPAEAGSAAQTAGRGSVAVIGERREGRRGLFGLRRARREGRGGLEVRAGEGLGASRGAADEGASERPLMERFDQLARVQQTRAAAARLALIQQADLDEEQVARVDQSVKRMNEQLAGYGEELIDQAARQEPPAPAQALGLGHDVSGILLEGQKQLDTIVGDAAQKVDPEALEVWNYVDLEQWRPFLEEQAQPAGGGTPSGGEE